jgi:hypothetical protein
MGSFYGKELHISTRKGYCCCYSIPKSIWQQAIEKKRVDEPSAIADLYE